MIPGFDIEEYFEHRSEFFGPDASGVLREMVDEMMSFPDITEGMWNGLDEMVNKVRENSIMGYGIAQSATTIDGEGPEFPVAIVADTAHLKGLAEYEAMS